jgi:hypothetical protein
MLVRGGEEDVEKERSVMRVEERKGESKLFFETKIFLEN